MQPTNLLALISVIGSLVSPVTWADLQMDETVDRSETWTIGYNNSLKGCVASAISADGTTVWVGFAGIESDVDVPAYLAFTNPNWRFIEARKFYEVEVRTVGSRRRKGYASGIEQSNDRGLFVLGVKWQLIEELVRGSGLLFSVNKGQPTAINISGSSDAIEKLRSCQQRRNMASQIQGIQPPRLAEEIQRPEREVAAWEKASRKREGEVVDERRDANEKNDEVKEPQVSGPTDWDTGVAMVPMPPSQPSVNPELKGGELVKAIKQELMRVGCYDGRIDEDWQTSAARASVQKYATLARLTISPAEPTNELLESIRVRSKRVCPIECGLRKVEKDGRCIAKGCPPGFALDNDGDCVVRQRMVRRHELEEPPEERRLRVRLHESKRRGRAGLDDEEPATRRRR